MAKVITAPLAIIKVNGVAIGKMRGIRVSETIRRTKVFGLGELTPNELPALEWSGTLNADFYNIDFRESQIPNAMRRTVGNVQEWVDHVLLQEDGVQVDIFKKVKDSVDSTGLIIGGLTHYASIQGLFLDSENFDITEGQVSGRNQSFTYLYPITYKS